eukprot:497205_1
METESKNNTYLSTLHDDALRYVISFLKGRDMARIERVCRRISGVNIEQIAHGEFINHHPNLQESFLKAHQKYTSMRSNSYKYAYHCIFCYPSVNEINETFKRELREKTNYFRFDHINYMIEKMFERGNIVIIINACKVLKKYVLSETAENVHLFCKRFVKYGTYLPHNRRLYDEFRVDRYDQRFRMQTKLFLLKYHRNDLLIGDAFGHLIHGMMIKCCEKGLTDIAVEFRKMGAVIKPDNANEIACETFYKNIGDSYWLDFVWMDFKDPGRCTSEELQKKLDSRIAIFSIGEIKDEEKLHDLSIVTNNTYYTTQQMVIFLQQLLTLNAVGEEIKDSVQWWVDVNAV